MRRILALLAGLLLSAIASAGEAIVSFKAVPGINDYQVAIGSCVAGLYGQDVPGGYSRVKTQGEESLAITIGRLEQGETFCFRVRAIAASGVPGEWLFLGSKRIPLDSSIQPPILSPPGTPTEGRVE